MAFGTDDRTKPSAVGWTRIATGLAQGIALWGLTEVVDGKAGTTANPVMLGALEAVALFAPFIVLAGLADMRRRPLIVWTAVAAVVLAALGAHDIGRQVAQKGAQWIAGETMVFLAAALFIAHHLVAGADADSKPIARFATYFDQAWKHGVQLAMSAAFVGVFWIVLFLGGALFKLIGITLIADVIDKPWFAFPATGTMFAAAVQLTDVRHGLIRGIRTVALTLLSWLLPVLVVLVGAFMASLPFTGLEPLWKTKSAAAILLSAAAVMIILINAAYQDGEPDEATPLVLRWAARIGGLLLVPLVAVAGYAVWLRIGQYGLTPDRIIATACVIAGVCYAVGYSVAAVLPGAWMKPLELTNIVTAFVVVGLILALFSPLADPARLSVNDQMARLAAGKVTPDKVDYAFLRFHGEKYGKAALDVLAKKGGVYAAKVKEARGWDNEWSGSAPTQPAHGPNVGYRADPKTLTLIWPAGKTLPADFLGRGWLDGDAKSLGCTVSAPCSATLVDLNGDGADEVLVVGKETAVVLARVEGQEWSSVFQTGLGNCPGLTDALKAGRIEVKPPEWRDLVVGGKRMAMDARPNDCDPPQPPQPITIRPGPPPPQASPAPPKKSRIRPVVY